VHEGEATSAAYPHHGRFIVKQKRTLTLAGFSLALLAFAVLAQQVATKDEVLGDLQAAARGWEMIEQGALLIEVRSQEEYSAGHIEGSANIPHTEADQIRALIGEDLSRPVVLYCRSGGRAGRVMSSLEDQGYTALFNATGWEALEATRPSAE
jgi:phage shock protein E